MIAKGREISNVDRRFSQVRTLFFCIGAQKCATTWLHDYFVRHPDVKVPILHKELHYWNTVRPPFDRHVDLSAGARIWYRFKRFGMRTFGGEDQRLKAKQWYLWERALRGGDVSHRSYADLLFFGYNGESAVGEITPEYSIQSSDVLTEMASLSPHSRFIFLMRDPIDRFISGCRMNLSRAGLSITKEALCEQVDVALSGDPHRTLIRSKYDKSIENIILAGMESRTCLMFYEQLFRDCSIRRLCEFLGVKFITGDYSKIVFGGDSDEVELPEEYRMRLIRELAPTYVFLRNYFDGNLPKEWKISE